MCETCKEYVGDNGCYTTKVNEHIVPCDISGSATFSVTCDICGIKYITDIPVYHIQTHLKEYMLKTEELERKVKILEEYKKNTIEVFDFIKEIINNVGKNIAVGMDDKKVRLKTLIPVLEKIIKKK